MAPSPLTGASSKEEAVSSTPKSGASLKRQCPKDDAPPEKRTRFDRVDGYTQTPLVFLRKDLSDPVLSMPVTRPKSKDASTQTEGEYGPSFPCQVQGDFVEDSLPHITFDVHEFIAYLEASGVMEFLEVEGNGVVESESVELNADNVMESLYFGLEGNGVTESEFVQLEENGVLEKTEEKKTQKEKKFNYDKLKKKGVWIKKTKAGKSRTVMTSTEHCPWQVKKPARLPSARVIQYSRLRWKASVATQTIL